MKIQITAIVSSDGYLQLDNPTAGKYGYNVLREHTGLVLHKESSLIALLEEKRQASGTNYLVATTSDTLNLVKGLFLYRLADELIVYMTPCPKENGIRLFDLTSTSDWKLTKQFSLKKQPHCIVYQRIS